MTGPPYHPGRTGSGRLAAVVRAVGVGAILAGRPLPQIAEEVLDPRRSGARRALVAPLLALGAPEPARLEEERDLPVRDQNAPAWMSMTPSARAARGAGAPGPIKISVAPSARPCRVHAVTRLR